MMERRGLLKALTAASIGSVLGARRGCAAEPPPETTRIRLVRIPSICRAPQYVADGLLRGEGFLDVQYVHKAGGGESIGALAAGEADISMNFSGPTIIRIDAGDPIVILGGVHTGCFEVIGTDRVRSIRDLKGKTVAVIELGGSEHVFLASMAAYVGLDPRKDIHWITIRLGEAGPLLAEGKIDAYLGFPPEPQELRVKKIGHVVVNSAVDRPWSQYFCCMATANREFVKTHPVATKRALRAILKATSICALEPDQVARALVDRGFAQQYEYALQTLKDIPYAKWRDYNPEGTVRFYGLRLHEVGMIKRSPQKIIAQGTDWRFFNELKRELKG
jgi:NitT/TauT family transport system substrate-binding protein